MTADEFLAIASDFQLGSLDTEAQHPIGDPALEALPDRSALELLALDRFAAVSHGGEESAPQLGGKAGIEDHDIRLACKQQREGIDVGRADRCPVVDHRDLGMQKAAVIFDDLDTGCQQRRIHRLRGQMRQGVFNATLQQQPHRHAASTRLDERPSEPAARKKIGIGDQDLALCTADRLQIGALD
jgi:hypothetical protein